MKRPDLEGYVLGELSGPERKQVEMFLATDGDAAAEVERLRLTTAALRHLAEEEPPRRIAFVSDKVFEPKWWHFRPSWGLAGAVAMLAVAIVAHGFVVRPAPTEVVQVAAQPDPRRIEAEVAKRVDAAVARIRAEADRNSKEMVAAALAEAEKKFALERQADRLAVEASFDMMRKQMNRLAYSLASATPGGRP